MEYKLAKLNDANNNLDQQWFVYYYFEHPETGKMVRFRKWISNRIKTKTGRRDKAHDLIKHINTRLKQGWNPYSESEARLTNTEEAFKFALSVKSASIGKRAKQTYRSITGMFLKYLDDNNLSNLEIGEINYKIVQEFFDQSMIYETIKARTYNNRVTALKTIFNFLQKREYISFNPVDKVEKLREPDPEIISYTKSELELIRLELPKYDYNLFVISQLIFYCFIRPAEIVRLQFKDIAWDHQLIIIPGSKSKNKKSEVITMPDQLIENLKDWNRNHNRELFIFSRKLQPGFKEIAPTRIAEAWKAFSDKYKLGKGIYALKHTGNGMAFDLGFNSRDIQLQNRHSSLEQTQQYLNKFRRNPSEKFKSGFNGF